MRMRILLIGSLALMLGACGGKKPEITESPAPEVSPPVMPSISSSPLPTKSPETKKATINKKSAPTVAGGSAGFAAEPNRGAAGGSRGDFTSGAVDTSRDDWSPAPSGGSGASDDRPDVAPEKPAYVAPEKPYKPPAKAVAQPDPAPQPKAAAPAPALGSAVMPDLPRDTAPAIDPAPPAAAPDPAVVDPAPPDDVMSPLPATDPAPPQP